MTNFIWFVCINAVIGIVLYIPTFVIFVLLMSWKYGDDITTEAIDRIIAESNDTYSALTDRPEVIRALSAIITMFLWEFALPMIFYMLYKAIVDLYNMRNRP